ncbi:MAG: arylsulfatase [Planctomycetes bacterium]|nr:arylsulfatase [Planctomycetota bacterium]
MADDLGYAELGCYGQTKIKTPNIDALAKRGMRFSQHYTSAPVCAPARCSLMTGKHGGHSYVRDNFRIGTWESFRGQLPLPEGTTTIASLFKKRDYATGGFGKWGLGEAKSSGDPLANGFDRFFGYYCQRHAHNYYPRFLIDDGKHRTLDGNERGVTGETYAPKVIADEMLKFVRQQHDAKRPFFLYYASVLPHLALQVPDEELAAYDFEDKPYKGKSYQPHDRPRAAYAAMISFLDKQVGRLVSTLEELGIADDTLILFTSDNGTTHVAQQVDAKFFESVGKLRGLKGSMYEGGIRVPLIAVWPGHVAPGSTSDLISAHYDTMATVAELLGVEAPPNDGISYLPTLMGKPESQVAHERLIWDFAGYGGQIAIRAGKYKLVVRNLVKKPGSKPELYDLENDPSEQHDLAKELPDLAANLHEQLIAERQKPETEAFRFGEYAK